jgi:exodeoxyribonuclease V beta subunit
MSIVQPKPRVIERFSPDHHAVIEASAGTGKTFTLEHLVIDLLLSTDVEIDQILVVTFTERAASELRARLRNKISLMLERATEPVSEAEPHWIIGDEQRNKLARALFGFDLASISTIHAFCQRVLLENAFMADRLFEQALVDGKSAFSRAFTRVLRTEIARDEKLRDYLESWLHDRRIDDLEDLLYECHQKRGDFSPPYREHDLLDAFGRLRALSVSAPRLELALGTARLPGATIRAMVERYARILEIAAEEHAPALLARLDEERRRRTGFIDYLVEKGRSARDPKIKELIASLEALDRAAPSLRSAVVQSFLPSVERKLREEKRARGQLDFDDMLSLLWESLNGPRQDALVGAIRARHRFALVDEFQDTDDVQWRIFRRIFLEDAPQCAMCVIGDPKQAIYGFRGADVHAYLSATRAIRDKGGARVTLSENHRASRPLVEALNTILDQRAERPFFTGAIRYDEPVTAASDLAPDFAPVHLFVLRAAAGELSIARARRVLGRAIAREIKELLAGRGPLTLCADDIFVLTRSGRESVEIGRALRSAGVPHAFYKEEGLFQTEEAGHIRDLLRAIADPLSRSRRFQAWIGPFFGVPLESLPACLDLPPTHPLLGRLHDWRALAERRDYDRLFTSIADDSGLIRRILFEEPQERELTNYLHILEILLEDAHATHATLEELVRRLSSHMEGRSLPDGENGNVQRLESERAAVQVMTMHKAKGLEARVVFLFGGFEASPSSVHAFHEGDRRLLAIGRRNAAIDRERDEEDQRLLYVALTRAKERLYLPHFEQAPKGLAGCYAHMVDVLARVVKKPGRSFSVEPVLVEPVEHSEEAALTPDLIGGWDRPLVDDPEPAIAQKMGERAEIRERRFGRAVTSYSRIKAQKGGYRAPVQEERDLELGVDVAESAVDEEEARLPGGTASGRLLHEVLEMVSLEAVRDAPSFDFWSARKDVRSLLLEALERHDRSSVYLDACQKLVWAALTSSLALGHATLEGGVARASRTVREMEFLYPLKEAELVKGFIDLVFEHQGKIYILDWKSDLLPSYAADAIAVHAAQNYALQAEIYTGAMIRLLGLRTRADYEARFGGTLFCFVRGMTARGAGVIFSRPSWRDIAHD